ncbi:sugar-binding transcriptional regulator [Cytobacillus gottheilii]|uniref:sugar-binding transcriptional regulator n=1 Tax=Cytobacillus gottheilii TaxID=859144 RepID=UPI0031E53634
MYYEDGLTQNQIAKELGIYRTTITRLLQKAKDQGIVTISIKGHSKELVDLERELNHEFNIEDIIIIPIEGNETSETRKRKLAETALSLLVENITDDDSVGLAWGSTLGKMIDPLRKYPKREIDFIPLIGGPGKIAVNEHVNTIVYNVAKAFNGRANFIDVPAVVPSKKTKEELNNSAYQETVVKLWKSITIAIIGIGVTNNSATLVSSGMFNDADIAELQNKGAVGEICFRFFDNEGIPIQTSIDERTISVQLDQLKNLRMSLALAESNNKVEAIIGALKGGYITHLITNDETAETILETISRDKQI